MYENHRTFLGAVAAAVSIAIMPTLAQQQGFTEHEPTKKDPLRFDAVAIQMQAGAEGRIEIVVERWSTEEERQKLVGLVAKTTENPRSQDKLLDALQHIDPRTGFMRTPESLGWDLKYAHENQLPDGTRQIVVITDKPVSFLAAASGSRRMDYPFTLVEMRFPAGSNKGEGKLLGQTALEVKDGKLQIEIYGQEPTRLTTITEHKPKGSK